MHCKVKRFLEVARYFPTAFFGRRPAAEIFWWLFGLPGDFEDAAKWVKILFGWPEVTDVVQMALNIAVVVSIIGLVAYDLRGKWVRPRRWLVERVLEWHTKPSQADIRKFSRMYRLVVQGQLALYRWRNGEPHFEGLTGRAQLIRTLATFDLACVVFENLGVWAPSRGIDDFDIDLWYAYLIRMEDLTFRSALVEARERGSTLGDPNPDIENLEF